MPMFLVVRLVLFAAGIIVWFVGFRNDDPTVRWVGIGMILLTLLLRFRRPPAAASEDEPR